MQMEKEVGSIVPGKLANFTILAENPLTVDPLTIKDIPIWGTVQEGRVLPVQTAVGTESGAVLGPVLDAPTLAARIEQDRHDAAQGAHADACEASRALSQAMGAVR
jgi:hypothetical protein